MGITSSTSNSYSADQLSQIDTLMTYVEDYCNANNIDPSVYLASLDGNTISDDLRNDPAFQAYWQLTYLQLMEVLDPSAINSTEAAIGEINFDAVYAAADSETNDLIAQLLQDDPELMAFAAAAAGQTEDGNSLLSMFTAANTAAATSTSVTMSSRSTSALVQDTDYLADVPDEVGGITTSDTGGNAMGDMSDARALDETYDLGEGYNWLIETEEGVRSTEASIFNYLAEMDQQLVDLKEALNSGQISAEEFESEVGSISIYRETMLGMLQQLESSLSTIFEMYSKLIEQATEMQMATINNMKPA